MVALRFVPTDGILTKQPPNTTAPNFMNVYAKISELVHSGNIEEIKILMQNVSPCSITSATLHCLKEAVACQNYEVVEHYIGQIPSETSTAYLFKMSIRVQDHKMVDILLQNTPNRFTCSEALLEAIEHYDVTTMQKIFDISTYSVEPLRFLLLAGKHGNSKALQYLLNKAPQEDDNMRVLLSGILHVENLSLDEGSRVLDVAMEYSSLNLLKKFFAGHSKNPSNYYAQRLCDYYKVRCQYEAINSAINTHGVKTTSRKM